MPSATIKHFAKKTKLSVDKVEELWQKTKQIVDKEYKYKKDDTNYWALRMGILKRMLGLSENIMFSDFISLYEAEVTPLQFKAVDENILNIIKKNCSKSMWMIEQDSPLWRGDRGSLSAKVKEVGAVVVNTSMSERMSENTSNWYTIIIDNSPYYKDYPKRSKSLVCTDDFKVAASYARHKNENVVAVIPFDDCKIGTAMNGGMWARHARIDNSTQETFVGMNNFFDELKKFGLNDMDWGSFKRLDTQLKKDKSLRNIFLKEFNFFFEKSKSGEEWADNFLQSVINAYAPGVIDISLETPGTLETLIYKGSKAVGNEFWISGKVLCLSFKTFMRLT